MSTRANQVTRKRSRCFNMVSWSANAKSIQSGKREPVEGSLGMLVCQFLRDGSVWQYPDFPYWLWREWRAKSLGRFYNANVRGLAY